MICIHRFFGTGSVLAALLSGCAPPSAVTPAPMPVDRASVPAHDAPAALHPPADQVLLSEAFATGVQIYECAASPTGAQDHQWLFKAPEAVLLDAAGRKIGRHHAGPTWESNDGSSVVGQVVARDPGTYADAIPWLLLSATAHAGTGVFSRVKSIQRLQTVAGIAPGQPCSAQNVGEVARVPYTAVYYFYAARP